MNNIYERMEQFKIIPVIALDNPQKAGDLALALEKGGIPCAEVTFRYADADQCIRNMRKSCPNMLIGAGTILTTAQVDQAVAAGAEFIVSPGLNPEVVTYCQKKDIPIIPGCVTPSDIEKAMELGLTYVKFFPAETYGGVKALKALSAPYTKMKFMPTGGITLDNCMDYLNLPCVFACGGSFIASKEMIKNSDFEGIAKCSAHTVALVNATKDTVNKDIITENNRTEAIEKNYLGHRVITFGELMLRLAPEGYLRFVQADRLEATFGGGEANVAVSLANYGVDTSFVTKIPVHEIGQAAINSLRKYGVDTSLIIRGGERLGIYYLEKGASQRPSKVIYDRAGSAIATASETDFDWDTIFEGASWFHFTGITPALSEELANICLLACKVAKKKGIMISCDLNYRSKLWSREKASSVMSSLCKYVDVCIANEEDAADVFGIRAAHTNVTSGQVDSEGYKEVAKTLAERFGFSYVAITLRKSLSASDNIWAAMLYDGHNYYNSREYPVHIVDRVGGGDSFGAGLIYGFLQNMEAQETLDFAVAASCLKHSIEGDYHMCSVDEVRKLAHGDASGRVQR